MVTAVVQVDHRSNRLHDGALRKMSELLLWITHKKPAFADFADLTAIQRHSRHSTDGGA
jgi:hypothetical protein